jgi:dolichol-phosphate mannosyltransferase
MTTGRRALVCLPTYDELENLRPMVEAIRAAVPAVEILVIDDNSPDGTGKLADELAAADRQVHVLHRAGKEGLGKAYLAGFAWALSRGYDLIMEMDCDFSHDPRYLPAASSSRAAGASTPAPSSASRCGISPAASSASGARCWRPSTSPASSAPATPSRSS